MRSSQGSYYIGLDHIRALAAFMVFSWHFMLGGGPAGGLGTPVPYSYMPDLFFLSIFDEGHTGVALFMTLSGYLFAKLLDGKQIAYKAFLWNRALRLVPLLVVVSAIFLLKKHLEGEDFFYHFIRIISGVVRTTLPNGGWSITVEFHFYLILPIILYFSRVWLVFLFFAILSFILFRYFLHDLLGTIQSISYGTIIGRIDQFVLGIAAFQFRSYIKGRHTFVVAALIAFFYFYWYFDKSGGFYFYESLYPTTGSIWVYITTIEGFAYAILIAWYDQSFVHSENNFSRFIARIGTYSYSIYLLHLFFTFELSSFIHDYVIDISNFYMALTASIICFFAILPICHLSYRYIELPFLSLRKPYVIES